MNRILLALPVVAAMLVAGCAAEGPITRPGPPTKAGPSQPPQIKPAPRAEPKAASADGAWTIILSDALIADADRRPLEIYVERRGDKWRQAFAGAPTWNRASHVVTALDLALASGAVKGTVKVTLNPDQWVPRDGKPLACTFNVDAYLVEGKLTGTFTGTCGTEAVKGAVGGQVTPVDAAGLKFCDVSLNIENVLVFGEDGKRRIEVNWPVRRGKSQQGKMACDLEPRGRGPMTTLPADTAGLSLSPGALTGELKFEIKWEKQVYTVRLKGIVVGTHVGGTFEGKAGDKPIKGVFTGTIREVPRW